MARHKLTKEQQLKGIRKALKNPRTPKQFLPSLRKRLAKLAVVALVSLLPSIAHAQFTGYVTPQTVYQSLAVGTACTGSAQTFLVQNLGQTQHYAVVVPSAAVTFLSMFIQAKDAQGNVFPISDTVFAGGTFQVIPAVNASSSYPVENVVVTCRGGTFTLTYSGTSSTSNSQTGAYLSGQIDKNLFQGASQGTTQSSGFFTPPFGSASGRLLFQYFTGSIAGSTLILNCQEDVFTNLLIIFTVANNTNTQSFQVPGRVCNNISVQYTSGGASANTYSLEYVFDPPGTNSVVTSDAVLGSANGGLNENALIAEKGTRWFPTQFSSPGAGVQATTTKAAGLLGIHHVADCVTWSAGASTAPVATVLTINLRDGASGVGTIVWQTQVTAAATAAQHGSGSICGLNIEGSASTAMTLEFSALLANESESVALTGYDVQ